MRVVGVGLIACMLAAGCALQPADVNDDTGMAVTSGLSAAPTTPPKQGAPRSSAVLSIDSAGAAGNTSPAAQTLPDLPSCVGDPPCDPDPQPWGGRPPPLWRNKNK
jgi:hypothetical protein